jgi:hypothetical protein
MMGVMSGGVTSGSLYVRFAYSKPKSGVVVGQSATSAYMISAHPLLRHNYIFDIERNIEF